MFFRRTPGFKQAPNSVAVLEKVQVGGIDQWLLMRGENRRNPILLFLHGGPGTAQIGIARPFQQALEERFVVVNWDQRGAGLSFDKGIPVETMNIEQFVSDTVDVVKMLLERFQQEKLFVVGHSWGSLLGMLVVERHPELFHAYLGIGQIAKSRDNERASYQFTLERARATGNEKAIRELEEIGWPPYRDLKHTRVQRRWLEKFGGVAHARDFNRTLFTAFLTSKEYTFGDAIRFVRGGLFSFHNMWPEVERFDLPERVRRVQVPVHFCIGKYDYNTPAELACEFLEQLIAPSKSLTRFENSAHCLNMEQPEKFCQVVIEYADTILAGAGERREG